LARYLEALQDVGRFKSKRGVWNPATPSRVEELELLVDTGAESLGLAADPVQKKLLPTFGMAFMGQVK